MTDIIEILQQIHDEADHILGTEAEFPLEAARQNAEAIFDENPWLDEGGSG